ncbi:hypothetical protein ACWD48_36435 [Streptomyces sp. NPDC002519]
MDIGAVLQQVKEARFGSSWEGCVHWSAGLVSWHLAQRPHTWAPLQEVREHAQTYISHVSSVIASALHATAVAEHLDAADGSQLLSVPLARAAELLSPARAFDTLASATPPDITLASLLHSIPVWIDAGDPETRSKGEFVLEQALDVLTAHAEHGHAVGDRLRAVLEVNYAVGDLP